MSKNKLKGLVMPAPPVPNTLIKSAKDAISPSTLAWGQMSMENKRRMYYLVKQAANQKFRLLERNGMTDSAIYQSVKAKGYRLKSGNVGFSSAGFNKWGVDKLKREYEKVYNAYKSESSSSNKKLYEEKKAEKLARVGIDVDELLAITDPIKRAEVNKELNDFWNLWTKGEEIGLWDKFGLSSYESQEFVKEIMKEGFRTYGKGSATRIINDALRKVNVYEYEAGQNAGRLSGNLNRDVRAHDIYMQQKMYLNYNDKKLKSISDLLISKLGEKVYGTTPIESAFDNIEDKEGLL